METSQTYVAGLEIFFNLLGFENTTESSDWIIDVSTLRLKFRAHHLRIIGLTCLKYQALFAKIGGIPYDGDDLEFDAALKADSDLRLLYRAARFLDY